jgi:hypothetical protein
VDEISILDKLMHSNNIEKMEICVTNEKMEAFEVAIGIRFNAISC